MWRIIEVGLEGLGNEFATDHNFKVNRSRPLKVRRPGVLLSV